MKVRVPDTDLKYLAFQGKVNNFENSPDHGTLFQECVFFRETVSLPLLPVSVAFSFCEGSVHPVPRSPSVGITLM